MTSLSARPSFNPLSPSPLSFCRLALLTWALGPSAAWAEVEISPGRSLEIGWGLLWRRVADRHGRPDPEGALQQRQSARQYPEYEMDLAVTDYPLHTERPWVRDPSGARLRIQSLNEFTFFHEATLKVQAPVGAGGYAGLRVDRRHDRVSQSDLLRLEIGATEIADSPIFAEIGLYARWEKEDIDVDLRLGAADPRWGRLSLRGLLLDPFSDVAYSLAESRSAALPRAVDRAGLPVALMVEAQSAPLGSWLLEAYGGIIPKVEAAYTLPTRPVDDHQRADSGYALGGQVERHSGPLILGASGLWVHTETRWWGFTEASTDPGIARNGAVVEDWRQIEGWALLALGEARRLEALVRWSDTDGALAAWAGSRLSNAPRPGEPAPLPPSTTGDRQPAGSAWWLTRLRLYWPLGAVVGLELGAMSGRRLIRGADRRREEGVDHRLTTRLTFQITDRLWSSLGVGWDLDDDGSVYDGGGFNLAMDL